MESTNTPNSKGLGANRSGSSTDAYRDAAQERVQDARDQLKAKSEEARAQLSPRIEAAKANAMEWQAQAESTVRERPWAALAVAAVAGIVIAKLLS